MERPIFWLVIIRSQACFILKINAVIFCNIIFKISFLEQLNTTTTVITQGKNWSNSYVQLLLLKKSSAKAYCFIVKIDGDNEKTGKITL